METLDKLLNGTGVSEVWKKNFELIQSVTGNVDVKTKGTLQSQVDAKVEKVDGKGLSTNDFTDDLKEKLNNLTVDTELSDTSEHPVQNKIIKAKIDDIDDKLSDKFSYDVDSKKLIIQTTRTDAIYYDADSKKLVIS